MGWASGGVVSDPIGIQPAGAWMDAATRKRFLVKLRRADNGCLIWTASLDGGGYGLFRANGQMRRSHIVAFTEWIGPVPAGLQLDHLCHTRDSDCAGGRACVHRACADPTHLEPVTSQVNVLRGRNPGIAAARERAKTHCVRGHLYDERNTYFRTRGGRKCRACNTARERALATTGSRRLEGSN